MRARFGSAVRGGRADETGSALVEFVFVCVLVMVPLVYVVVAVASVQRAQLAVTNAAREAGRAFATAATTDQGLARARLAAGVAFTDAGYRDRPVLRFVPLGGTCTDAEVTPTLAPGAEFTVCVRRQSALPAVPSVLQGRGVVDEGRFPVHVDDYRSG